MGLTLCPSCLSRYVCLLSLDNVLFVNGMFDPWHTLSITKLASGSSGVQPIMIADGSHCANCSPASPQDTQPVVAARQVQCFAWCVCLLSALF